MNALKTVKQVREEFRQGGIVISEWAEKNGFRATTVYSVLHGESQGIRGEAHKVAVTLGLKEGFIVNDLKGMGR